MTTSIPLWVPLVVAILGVIGTVGGAIAGVIITQRRSDRRENMSYQRERERERERWAREDAARTFELRREAYIEFYTAVRRQIADLETVSQERVHQMRQPFAQPTKLSRDIAAQVDRAVEKVRLYGSVVVGLPAEKMRLGLLLERRALEPAEPPWSEDVFQHGELKAERLQDLAQEERELLRVIRSDLGIPLGDIETNTETEACGGKAVSDGRD